MIRTTILAVGFTALFACKRQAPNAESESKLVMPRKFNFSQFLSTDVYETLHVARQRFVNSIRKELVTDINYIDDGFYDPIGAGLASDEASGLKILQDVQRDIASAKQRSVQLDWAEVPPDFQNKIQSIEGWEDALTGNSRRDGLLRICKHIGIDTDCLDALTSNEGKLFFNRSFEFSKLPQDLLAEFYELRFKKLEAIMDRIDASKGPDLAYRNADRTLNSNLYIEYAEAFRQVWAEAKFDDVLSVLPEGSALRQKLQAQGWRSAQEFLSKKDEQIAFLTEIQTSARESKSALIRMNEARFLLRRFADSFSYNATVGDFVDTAAEFARVRAAVAKEGGGMDFIKNGESL